MIASLGMYDMLALRSHNDVFWSAIRSELGFGPTDLTRADDPWPIWQSDDLLFSQTCGFPYRARLHGAVALVGTPDYGIEGCPPGHYCSVMVARADDSDDPAEYEGARLAYNEALSQSGWAAPTHWLAAKGIQMGALVETGAHAASAQFVADGRADLAGLDALTWTLMTEHKPELARRMRVIAHTEPTPVLPYITALTHDAKKIGNAVETAIAKLPQTTRSALHLRALVQIPAADYLAVPTPVSPDTYKTTAPKLT